MHRFRTVFWIVAAIAGVIFVMSTLGNSGPHLRSASSNDLSGTIQAISGLIGAVSGLLALLVRKPKDDEPASGGTGPARFKEVPQNYTGKDVVFVDVFMGYDPVPTADFQNRGVSPGELRQRCFAGQGRLARFGRFEAASRFVDRLQRTLRVQNLKPTPTVRPWA